MISISDLTEDRGSPAENRTCRREVCSPLVYWLAGLAPLAAIPVGAILQWGDLPAFAAGSLAVFLAAWRERSHPQFWSVIAISASVQWGMAAWMLPSLFSVLGNPPSASEMRFEVAWFFEAAVLLPFLGLMAAITAADRWRDLSQFRAPWRQLLGPMVGLVNLVVLYLYLQFMIGWLNP